MKMRPYSLYAYGQFDGRIHFLYSPWPHRDTLLTNITSLAVLFPKVPRTRCTLVLMSYDPDCLITFDARYQCPPYEELLAEGGPLVFEIDGDKVTVERLDANVFFGRW